MSPKEEVDRITQKIIDQYKPEKIILFGSYAWGEPKESSDLDLFIVKNTKEPRSERFVTVSRVINNRQIPVDIVVYTPKEIERRLKMGDFFVRRIIKEGKYIYGEK